MMNETTATGTETAAKEQSMEELYGPVISTYSRAQALDDGQLIDVSSTAQEAGIRFPVALTVGVQAWVDPHPMPAHQNAAGRLWDVISILKFAMRGIRAGTDRISYSVLFAGGPGVRGRRRVALVAVCGPGDDAEPVITIMLPGED